MHEMGIAAIYPGPNLSRRHPDHRVYPYLLRHVTVAHPNQVWGVDITYVRLRGSWLYLVAILDWYSRYVIRRALKSRGVCTTSPHRGSPELLLIRVPDNACYREPLALESHVWE